jgi:hypothetical protein
MVRVVDFVVVVDKYTRVVNERTDVPVDVVDTITRDEMVRVDGITMVDVITRLVVICLNVVIVCVHVLVLIRVVDNVRVTVIVQSAYILCHNESRHSNPNTKDCIQTFIFPHYSLQPIPSFL